MLCNHFRLTLISGCTPHRLRVAAEACAGKQHLASKRNIRLAAQVYVRRSPQGQLEVEVEPESMSDSPSRQLVAEMMIMAGEVIGDLGQWPISLAPAAATICTLPHCVQCARSTIRSRMRVGGRITVWCYTPGVALTQLSGHPLQAPRRLCRCRSGGRRRPCCRAMRSWPRCRPASAGRSVSVMPHPKHREYATQEFRASVLGSPRPHCVRVASLHRSAAG